MAKKAIRTKQCIEGLRAWVRADTDPMPLIVNAIESLDKRLIKLEKELTDCNSK